MKKKRADFLKSIGARFLGNKGPALLYVAGEPSSMFRLFSLATEQYYWRYYDSAVVFGPFSTLEHCNDVVENKLTTDGRRSDMIPDNVVEADFKLKRRRA